MTNRELNAPPYKLLVRPSFTQSGCFRVIAWHPARIWVWTAPGTCTKYTRRPRGFAGAAAAVVSGFFPVHLPNTFSAVFNISFESKSPTSSNNPFFFFQAEDGIRDGRVTGVQTCALPI